jgi:hypothetical protein
MLVIATECQYQVVTSHSYTNFHSIDDLCQVLLNQYMERHGVSSIKPHLRKVYQDSSWEGGTPAFLHHIPADDEIKELYDIYTDMPVAAPAPSDSSSYRKPLQRLWVTDIMSAPTASCLPSAKAREAMKYVIGMVLDFNPVDDCPLWLAMLNDATDENQVNLYNQWLLTVDDILALQYRPEPSKQKIVPLSRGSHTHVTRFKAMYSELLRTPGWTDLDIFKITYDEYMAFSRQYMAGQITSNPLSPAPNLYTSFTDPVTLFTKSIKQEPKDFPVIN